MSGAQLGGKSRAHAPYETALRLGFWWQVHFKFHTIIRTLSKITNFHFKAWLKMDEKVLKYINVRTIPPSPKSPKVLQTWLLMIEKLSFSTFVILDPISPLWRLPSLTCAPPPSESHSYPPLVIIPIIKPSYQERSAQGHCLSNIPLNMFLFHSSVSV